MNENSLNELYDKITKDNKYKPIIDCITLKLIQQIKEQFIAKEQLLDRCESDDIIYNLSSNDLTDIQLLGMINNELKNKNSLLLKQNIKLKERNHSLETNNLVDNNEYINDILFKLEMDYLRKENNELKYYIRNYSNLSKDLYSLQQIENLIHVNEKKDLFISNPLKYEKCNHNKLVEHLELSNKLLVYNYYDSCNLADYDIREFISKMNELIDNNNYNRDDNHVYNDLINKLDNINIELDKYKSDEKLFMYHIEKVSYSLLKEIAKKNKKDHLSIPYTCLSIALSELNIIKHKIGQPDNKIDELIDKVELYMDGYDKGFLNVDMEKNIKLLKQRTIEVQEYKDKCILYEQQISYFNKLLSKNNSNYNNKIDYVIKSLNKILSILPESNLNSKERIDCEHFVNKITLPFKNNEPFDSNIYALKHYIYYLINFIIQNKK